MKQKYWIFAGAAVLVSVLVYFKLLILAAAVAFATLYRHSRDENEETPAHASIRTRPDTEIPGDGDNPYGEAYWNVDAPEETPDANAEKSINARPSVNSVHSINDGSAQPSRSSVHGTDEENVDTLVDFDFPHSFVQPSGERQRGSERSDRKGGKGDGRNSQANPRQVYVGGLPFKTEESGLREFFNDNCGPIEQVKLLRQQDGKSKGVAFITFLQVEDAQKALHFHDKEFEGRTLTVRIANPTGGMGKSDKGGDRNERTGSSSYSGKGGPQSSYGVSKGHQNRLELDRLIQESLSDNLPLEIGDFDFQARRLLTELRSRDKTDGTARCQEAIDNVAQSCAAKERAGVRNWKAYVFTLLYKQNPDLVEELRERDRLDRAQKGGKVPIQ